MLSRVDRHAGIYLEIQSDDIPILTTEQWPSLITRPQYSRKMGIGNASDINSWHKIVESVMYQCLIDSEEADECPGQ
jgi:hypothetical protein